MRDQPAPRAALDAHDEVVAVFCLDDRLLHGRYTSGPRTQSVTHTTRGVTSEPA